MRRLIIRCAETSDAGTYSCQSGDNSLSFTVNIKGMYCTLAYMFSCHVTGEVDSIVLSKDKTLMMMQTSILLSRW